MWFKSHDVYMMRFLFIRFWSIPILVIIQHKHDLDPEKHSDVMLWDFSKRGQLCALICQKLATPGYIGIANTSLLEWIRCFCKITQSYCT